MNASSNNFFLGQTCEKCFPKDGKQRDLERLRLRLQQVTKKSQDLEDMLFYTTQELEKEKETSRRIVQTLTERLMESTEMINKLEMENMRYKKDCMIAVELLQCNKFVNQAHVRSTMKKLSDYTPSPPMTENAPTKKMVKTNELPMANSNGPKKGDIFTKNDDQDEGRRVNNPVVQAKDSDEGPKSPELLAETKSSLFRDKKISPVSDQECLVKEEKRLEENNSFTKEEPEDKPDHKPCVQECKIVEKERKQADEMERPQPGKVEKDDGKEEESSEDREESLRDNEQMDAFKQKSKFPDDETQASKKEVVAPKDEFHRQTAKRITLTNDQTRKRKDKASSSKEESEYKVNVSREDERLSLNERQNLFVGEEAKTVDNSLEEITLVEANTSEVEVVLSSDSSLGEGKKLLSDDRGYLAEDECWEKDPLSAEVDRKLLVDQEPTANMRPQAEDRLSVKDDSAAREKSTTDGTFRAEEDA